MALTISKPPTGTANLPSGLTVSIRGLTRAEAVQLRTMRDDPSAIEIHCIRYACGLSEDEATEWWTESRQDDVEELVNEISRLSGLDEKTGKADAEGLHSAKSTQSNT